MDSSNAAESGDTSAGANESLQGTDEWLSALRQRVDQACLDVGERGRVKVGLMPSLRNEANKINRHLSSGFDILGSGRLKPYQ